MSETALVRYDAVALADPAVIASARLPVVYEAACVALQQCANVDECKLWADKMSALQSYARQTNDDTLLNFAKRIKGRAVRQMGKILREIPPAKNQHDARETALPSRSQAATDAGLTNWQKKESLRVAAVDDESFEAQVESENPPTVNALAEQGTKKKPHSLEGVEAADHIVGTRLIGIISYVLREAKRLDIAQGTRGVKPSELAQLLLDIREAVTILHRIYLSVEEREKECMQASS